MKLEVEIPKGADFHGLYCRHGKWGAILACTPLYWPSKYRQTFLDLRPPEPKFHSCSSGSTGCDTPQAAIDLAFEKLQASMAMLDGITRAPTRRHSSSGPNIQHLPIDTAVVAGLDLGDLDL